MSDGPGFSGGIFLGNQKNQSVAGQRFFDGADRHVTSDEQRQHHVGVNYDVANRQERQHFGDIDLRTLVVRTLGFPFSFAHDHSNP
jgi:hypothetical protein